MFISAEHLDKQINLNEQTISILRDVNLNIEYKSILAIMGISGSGKSTLLGLLAGLDLPSNGRVIFEGKDFNLLTENERANIRLEAVSFIFQNFLLMPSLNALQNVMLPLVLKNAPDIEERARELLQAVGLADRQAHHPHQLSGGEQQRVAIARAFVSRPRVLFADEPTANLDYQTSTKIIDLLLDLNEKYHTTLVCVTHDERLAARCHRILHLENGTLT